MDCLRGKCTPQIFAEKRLEAGANVAVQGLGALERQEEGLRSAPEVESLAEGSDITICSAAHVGLRV